MSDLADQIREIAELRMYDGNTDQPLEGYMEALCLADEVDALVAKLAEVEQERGTARRIAGIDKVDLQTALETARAKARFDSRESTRREAALLRDLRAAEARLAAVLRWRDEYGSHIVTRDGAAAFDAALAVPAGTAQPGTVTECDPANYVHTGPWVEVKPFSDVNRCANCGTEIGK